jgi:hypothetical protein
MYGVIENFKLYHNIGGPDHNFQGGGGGGNKRFFAEKRVFSRRSS